MNDLDAADHAIAELILADLEDSKEGQRTIRERGTVVPGGLVVSSRQRWEATGLGQPSDSENPTASPQPTP